MSVDDKDVLEISGFKGLRNVVPSVGFDLGDLEVALNVDCDDAGILHRRFGHGAVVVAGVDRDLWAAGSQCLGVGSNTLKRILPDYSTVTLHSGLTAGRPLSYVAVGDRAYYANGAEMGVVTGSSRRAWGLTLPALPVATATGGALRPGRYQYVLTYLRSDGQESGAARAGIIALTDIGGISLTSIPVSSDADVTHKVLYVSDVDSEKLWRYAVLPNATTSFSVLEARIGSVQLATQFLTPPPAGDIIAYGNGRMLVAAGHRLYPSEPYAPELFDLRKGVPFTAPLTMVASLEDGTWIGTESEVVWLPDAEPEKWQFRKRCSYGVHPGSSAPGDGHLVGNGSNKQPCVFFMTHQGPCAGLTGGELVQFTEGHYNIPKQSRGVGVVRQHRGISQYVCTLQGVETAASVAA